MMANESVIHVRVYRDVGALGVCGTEQHARMRVAYIH